MVEHLDDSTRKAIQERATGMSHADAVIEESRIRSARERLGSLHCFESYWQQKCLDFQLAEWERIIQLLSEDGFGSYSRDKDPAAAELEPAEG
ncbi:hypothetical protein ACFYZ9_37975 [Streptomyces sp. NPDC001691]|uniref:hypothetical protein n=1 Tax=Streptomyces sp. NPDC001691 TaxID=3364600 RepID=UPI0036C87BA3